MVDLIYVTYNSEKWIKNCFDSVVRSDFDLNEISVYVVDNASSDNTLAELEKAKRSHEEKLNRFEILSEQKNHGFGKGNNIGFSHGTGDIVCFFNIDTELYPDTLRELLRDINESESDVALWELRQFPYEHPKFYDPLTHVTGWSSGAAFAMRRELFQKVRGFDEHIFMYAEDVDLSWRLRSFGYKLKYVPKAVINHYAYSQVGEIKPTQYLHSMINNLLLRYRFGTWKDICWGNVMVLSRLVAPVPFKGARKRLLALYLKHFFQIGHFRRKGMRGNSDDFKPTFYGFDYSMIREGAFYKNERPHNTPLVSVIVRTCGRPAVLRETLISLREQTYPNIEVVVVEDGEAKAEAMIRAEFSNMNISYRASGKKVGRSKVGNMAMMMAKGKYLNFLDDDDLFYADHVEVLVRALEKTKHRAAYAFAFETPIEVESKDPYKYTVYNYLDVYKQTYNKMALCHHNYIPIQCIMFEKALFEEYGGLDESLDALEDWDMWVRYSLHTDFSCVKKTTSIYRVPKERTVSEARQKTLDDALVIVRNKEKSYTQHLNAYDLAMMYSPENAERLARSEQQQEPRAESEQEDEPVQEMSYGRMFYLKEFIKHCVKQEGRLYRLARRSYHTLYASRHRVGK